MQNENVIQANPSSETIQEIKSTKRIYERFGVSPCHLGPDGKRVGSVIMIIIQCTQPSLAVRPSSYRPYHEGTGPPLSIRMGGPDL